MNVKIILHLNDTEVILDIDEDIRFIDLKKFILKKYVNITDDKKECKYIDLENINEKITKNFGKMYFEKGILPRVFDNFNISKFMDNNEEINFKIIEVYDYDINNIIDKPINKIMKAYVPPSKRKEVPKDFNYFEEDFPPL